MNATTTIMTVHPDGSASIDSDALAELGVNGDSVDLHTRLEPLSMEARTPRYQVHFKLIGNVIVEAEDRDSARKTADSHLRGLDVDSCSVSDLGPVAEVR